MLSKQQKGATIKKFAIHEGDTGSSHIQIALLTKQVSTLTDHLRTHKKDHSSRRGLLKMVGQRRRLMRYLKKEDSKGYGKILQELKLKDLVTNV